MTETCEICIVGAGAAGIWAAERAAREGADVLLVEKTPRVGTKILASGGAKCNLTTTLDARAAARLFGEEGERFLRHAFRAMTPEQVRWRFEALGVRTKTAPLEKVFPVSERAVEVRDALEEAARDAGARIMLEAPVVDIGPDEDGWHVVIDGGRRVECSKLLMCPGGMSYPGSGTTGDGYRWMEKLGLEIVEPVPDLVGLVSPRHYVDEYLDELAGVDIQRAETRIVDGDGRVLGRRLRPVVFTHDGISGPGAMDLAEHVTRPRAERSDAEFERTILVDMYPQYGHDELRQMLVEAAQEPGATGVQSVLPQGAPTSVFRTACRMVGLPEKGLMISQLPKEGRNKLVDHLKGFPVPVIGSDGFDHAEVTAGGVDLKHVDSRTMHVDEHPGLYVFGEILNLAGPIGGLNFQAAWSEAELAATAAVEALEE